MATSDNNNFVTWKIFHFTTAIATVCVCTLFTTGITHWQKPGHAIIVERVFGITQTVEETKNTLKDVKEIVHGISNEQIKLQVLIENRNGDEH